MSFKSAAVWDQLSSALATQSPDQIKKVNAIFQFDIKNGSGAVQSWTLNLKNPASPKQIVTSGTGAKPDIVISVADADFVELAAGKLSGQKAFMAGKLKVKGNMMLATKLDGVFKQAASAKPAAASKPAASGGATGGSVKVAGYASSDVFQQIKDGLASGSTDIKKVNAVFQFDVKNSSGQVQSWTLNMKTPPGGVAVGAASGGVKPDIVISVADADFADLAAGKTTGQKAFMQGKIKVKGNMMLATKLDGVLKNAKAKL